MAEVVDTPSRSLTPKARRRSWSEPAVRIWLIAMIVLLIVTSWLFIEQMQVARYGQYRLSHWTRINDVKIEKIGREIVHTFRATPDIAASVVSLVSYTDQAGTKHELEGYLAAQAAPIRPGDLITVLVDPQNPTKWTDRLIPLPMAEILMGPLVVLPLPVLCLGIALWQRFRILRIWKSGIERQGRIVGRKTSAAAPRSVVLQCAMEGTRDNRIVSVTMPLSCDPPQKGSILTLITSPGIGSSRAIISSLYQ